MLNANSTGEAAPNPRVVILGAGFGGLSAAKELAGAPFAVTLIDRHNYHLFQPLLYQVATAGLAPSDIAGPIRGIVSHAQNVNVVLAQIGGVDVEGRAVIAEGHRIPFDYLIAATGAQHAYFGHDDWAPIAPGLKTLDDATYLRRRILLAFKGFPAWAVEPCAHLLLDRLQVPSDSRHELGVGLCHVSTGEAVDHRYFRVPQGGHGEAAAKHPGGAAHAQRRVSRVSREIVWWWLSGEV